MWEKGQGFSPVTDWQQGPMGIRSSRELKKKLKNIFVHLYRSCYTCESQRSRKLQQEATSTQKHTSVCSTHSEAVQCDSSDYGIVAIPIPPPHPPGKKKNLRNFPFNNRANQWLLPLWPGKNKQTQANITLKAGSGRFLFFLAKAGDAIFNPEAGGPRPCPSQILETVVFKTLWFFAAKTAKSLWDGIRLSLASFKMASRQWVFNKPGKNSGANLRWGWAPGGA